MIVRTPAGADRKPNVLSAINWASSLASGILSALGGGSPIVHGGTSKTTTTSSVVMNGTIETGINSHLSLTLNDNTNWVAGDPISQAVTAAAGASPQIQFSVGTEIPVSPLFQALAYDEQQLAEYGADNAALNAYYSGEVTRIENELEAEGLLTILREVAYKSEAEIVGERRADDARPSERDRPCLQGRVTPG